MDEKELFHQYLELFSGHKSCFDEISMEYTNLLIYLSENKTQENYDSSKNLSTTNR